MEEMSGDVRLCFTNEGEDGQWSTLLGLDSCEDVAWTIASPGMAVVELGSHYCANSNPLRITDDARPVSAAPGALSTDPITTRPVNTAPGVTHVITSTTRPVSSAPGVSLKLPTAPRAPSDSSEVIGSWSAEPAIASRSSFKVTVIEVGPSDVDWTEMILQTRRSQGTCPVSLAPGVLLSSSERTRLVSDAPGVIENSSETRPESDAPGVAEFWSTEMAAHRPVARQFWYPEKSHQKITREVLFGGLLENFKSPREDRDRYSGVDHPLVEVSCEDRGQLITWFANSDAGPFEISLKFPLVEVSRVEPLIALSREKQIDWQPHSVPLDHDLGAPLDRSPNQLLQMGHKMGPNIGFGTSVWTFGFGSYAGSKHIWVFSFWALKLGQSYAVEDQYTSMG